MPPCLGDAQYTINRYKLNRVPHTPRTVTTCCPRGKTKDRAGLQGDHARQSQLTQQEWRTHIDPQTAVHHVNVHVHHRQFTVDPGVVHHDIQSSKALQSVSDQGADILDTGHITPHPHRCAATV